jgi:predicted ATPase
VLVASIDYHCHHLPILLPMTASLMMQEETSVIGNSSTSDHDLLEIFESRLPLHRKLVGRDQEIKEIEIKYQQRKKQLPDQGAELLLITGPSGTGKSTLARSLEPAVLRDGGYFLAGKCSPPHHHHQSTTQRQQQGPRRQLIQEARSEGTPLTTPYAPFVAALSQFVEQVIARGDGAIQQVRDAIQDESDAAILIDLIPDFRRIQLPTRIIPPESSVSTNTTNTGMSPIAGGGAGGRPHRRRGRNDSLRDRGANSIRTTSTFTSSSSQKGSTDFKGRTNLSVDAAASPTLLVLTKFLVAFCGGYQLNQHGGRRRTQDLLVLVLDDIQWIDRASLELMKILVSEEILVKGLTLVCTCRGNEVAVGDPLAVLLRELEESLEVCIVNIPLHDLAEPEVDQVVAQTLKLPPAAVKSLSSLCHQQTLGNPFAVLQLLRCLYEKHLLYSPSTTTTFPRGSNMSHGSGSVGSGTPSGSSFDFDFNVLSSDAGINAVPTNGGRGLWQWDTKEINKLLDKLNRQNTDALSSRIEHIGKTSEVVHQVLQIAACMASEFEVKHMQLILKGVHPGREVRAALAFLEEKNLIVVSKNPTQDGTSCSTIDEACVTGDKGISTTNTVTPTPTKKKSRKKASYCWAHDRFHQAAYNLIPEKEQQQIHKSIGLKLLYSLTFAELEKYVFLVVNHLLPVDPDLLERDEKYEVVLLCVLAGQRSAEMSAFQSAGVYFNIGICYFNMDVGLVEENRWTKQYDLKLSLYNAAAEMAYCNGDNEAVDGLVGYVFDHARCFEDKLRCYETQLHSLCARNMLDEAIGVGLDVLKRLGEPFTVATITPQLVVREVQKCRRLLQKPDEFVLGLRPLQDWKKITAIRMIQLMFPPVFQSQPQLGTLLAARSIQLTFDHGLTALSCAGFAVMGTVLCYPKYGLYAEGNRLVNLGLKIMATYETSEMKCRMLCYANGFCAPYVQPTRICLDGLALGAQAGAESGDMEMSCTNLLLICMGSVFAGDRLDDVLRLISRYQRRALVLQQHKIVAFMSFITQMILNLLGKARDPHVLTGDASNEEEAVREFQAAGNLRALESIDLFKCFLAVYLKKYDLARVLALKMRGCKKSGMNALCLTQFIFLDAMAEVTVEHPSKWKSLLAGRSPLRRLKEYARLCPENMLNKVYLIEAERYAIRGHRDKALAKYVLSIEHAEHHGVLQEQALAYERAGLRLLEWDREVRGLEYLSDAKNIYERWGASYKVDQLGWLAERDTPPSLDTNSKVEANPGVVHPLGAGLLTLVDDVQYT